MEEGWQLCQKLRARLEQMLAIPPETPVVTPPEPAVETQAAIPDAVAPPEGAKATAGRGPSRSIDLAVARLAKLVVELEWAILNEAFPPPGKIDPLTATDEEIKAYLVLNPRFGRPPPREPAHTGSCRILSVRRGTAHRSPAVAEGSVGDAHKSLDDGDDTDSARIEADAPQGSACFIN